MPPLSPQEAQSRLASLAGWQIVAGELVKTFQFKNFRDALTFIVRIGLEAEGLDHHPEIKNVYNKVDLALNTHDAGGRVTALDVELARKIERCPAARA